jgi:DNA replication initiation complex subunit (GINS family)
LDYKELYQLWVKEKRNQGLLEIPADFYISMDGKLGKLYKDSQDLEWKGLANIIIERMEFLRNDLAQIRLAKIMNLVVNNENIDENVITWGERRLIKNLRQSIQMLGIEKPNILDTQNESPDMDLADNSEAETPQIEEKISNNSISSANLIVRILNDVKPFIGIDNRQWGPYLAYDIACLPSANAKALIARAAARVIESAEINGNKIVSGEK